MLGKYWVARSNSKSHHNYRNFSRNSQASIEAKTSQLQNIKCLSRLWQDKKLSVSVLNSIFLSEKQTTSFFFAVECLGHFAFDSSSSRGTWFGYQCIFCCSLFIYLFLESWTDWRTDEFSPGLGCQVGMQPRLEIFHMVLSPTQLPTPLTVPLDRSIAVCQCARGNKQPQWDAYCHQCVVGGLCDRIGRFGWWQILT